MMKTIPIALLMLAAATATAQTTVTFKPGAAVGEDAYVWSLDNNCIPSGSTVTPANQNFGNKTEISISRWTWTAANCRTGTVRSYIRFQQLNTIPANATIVSAKLKLYTPSASAASGLAGNNNYPGSPLPNTNPGWVKRVLPGNGNAASPNNWKEQTITWNSALSVGTDPVMVNWATIPVTGSEFSWVVPPIDVTTMVQNIVSELATDPFANNGFMLQLQTEEHYRSQLYASSDGAEANLWPALEVTYTVCDPGFSYCAHSANPFIYTLTANNTTQASYSWTVDGNPGGNTPSVNTPFLNPISIPVCLNVAGQCKKCVYICPGDNPTLGANPGVGDFTFCSNTNAPYTYSFSAIPGQSAYSWVLNGVPIASTANFSYTFPGGPSGNYLCLKSISPLGVTTERCLQFCMGQNRPSGPGTEEPATGIAAEHSAPEAAAVTIAPNPARDGWNIRLYAATSGTVILAIYDVTGKLLHNSSLTVNEGNNSLYQDARAFPAGLYYLSITGAHLNAKIKAVKE